MHRLIYYCIVFVLMITFSNRLSAINLQSDSFHHHGDIPTQYAYTSVKGGKNKSLNLYWNTVPVTTRSFAIIMWDSNKVAKEWVHWLVINIPSDVTKIAENASHNKMPDHVKELINSFGKAGYGGPGPPKGTGRHDYFITIYALNVEKLNLSGKISRKAFKKALNGKIIAKKTIIGYYER